MSILWLKSTIRRVCVSSPPSRTSLATGKSLGALGGAADGPMRSAADAPPKTSPLRTIALKGKARILTRTDMGGPCEPVLLHYGGAVNPNLPRRLAVPAAGKPLPCHRPPPALIKGC